MSHCFLVKCPAVTLRWSDYWEYTAFSLLVLKKKNSEDKGLLLKGFYMLPALLFCFPVHLLSSATVGTPPPLADTSKAIARAFSKSTAKRNKHIFLSTGVSCQISEYMWLWSPKCYKHYYTICFYAYVCCHSYKIEEFPITCSSTVHSWLKVSGLVSSQSRPLIICSNTGHKMENVFRKIIAGIIDLNSLPT